MPLCAGDILQSPAEPCPASVGDDACIVPETLQRRKPHAAGEIVRRGGRQPGRILAGQGTAPLSRLTPPAPLTGEPSGWQALYKASPARGCGVERRLRRRKRDGAGLTVAEHKRASARAVRCGHRKPDGGCAARRRRRGALPLLPHRYPANPGSALPCIRRGRCLHRPANPAISQPPCGGRDRPPYIAAGSEWQRISTSLPPGPPEGRCKHRPPRRGAALHNRHPPAMPAAPPIWHPTAFAQRWDRLVRRGRVWYNSRKAARPVWLMPGRQPPLNAHGVMRGAKSSTLFCIPGRRGGPALAGPPTGEAG